MKGQKAIETLLEYGWAILLMLIVAGVLAYYGIFAPKAFLVKEASYDIIWNNNALGLTYFCKRDADVMSCRTFECYDTNKAFSNERFCREVGAMPLEFALHD